MQCKQKPGLKDCRIIKSNSLFYKEFIISIKYCQENLFMEFPNQSMFSNKSVLPTKYTYILPSICVLESDECNLAI